MNYIVNTLARYEVHVARYYYKRGAYVAAANRAQQAVITYELEIETDGRADRIAIGLLDDTSREWGVMTIPLGSRRRTDGT